MRSDTALIDVVVSIVLLVVVMIRVVDGCSVEPVLYSELKIVGWIGLSTLLISVNSASQVQLLKKEELNNLTGRGQIIRPMLFWPTFQQTDVSSDRMVFGPMHVFNNEL